MALKLSAEGAAMRRQRRRLSARHFWCCTQRRFPQSWPSGPVPRSYRSLASFQSFLSIIINWILGLRRPNIELSCFGGSFPTFRWSVARGVASLCSAVCQAKLSIFAASNFSSASNETAPQLRPRNHLVAESDHSLGKRQDERGARLLLPPTEGK
jgi:hypothetical protein